jgi:hypothetical protein
VQGESPSRRRGWRSRRRPPPDRHRTRALTSRRGGRGRCGRRTAARPAGRRDTTTRALMQVARPYRTERHELGCCTKCGPGLARRRITDVKRRQVFDLLSMKIQVTEHQLIERECTCGRRTKADAPPRVDAPCSTASGSRQPSAVHWAVPAGEADRAGSARAPRRAAVVRHGRRYHWSRQGIWRISPAGPGRDRCQRHGRVLRDGFPGRREAGVGPLRLPASTPCSSPTQARPPNYGGDGRSPGARQSRGARGIWMAKVPAAGLGMPADDRHYPTVLRQPKLPVHRAQARDDLL